MPQTSSTPRDKTLTNAVSQITASWHRIKNSAKKKWTRYSWNCKRTKLTALTGKTIKLMNPTSILVQKLWIFPNHTVSTTICIKLCATSNLSYYKAMATKVRSHNIIFKFHKSFKFFTFFMREWKPLLRHICKTHWMSLSQIARNQEWGN